MGRATDGGVVSSLPTVGGLWFARTTRGEESRNLAPRERARSPSGLVRRWGFSLSEGCGISPVGKKQRRRRDAHPRPGRFSRPSEGPVQRCASIVVGGHPWGTCPRSSLNEDNGRPQIHPGGPDGARDELDDQNSPISHVLAITNLQIGPRCALSLSYLRRTRAHPPHPPIAVDRPTTRTSIGRRTTSPVHHKRRSEGRCIQPSAVNGCVHIHNVRTDLPKQVARAGSLPSLPSG
jgi:hypothetical protein